MRPTTASIARQRQHGEARLAIVLLSAVSLLAILAPSCGSDGDPVAGLAWEGDASVGGGGSGLAGTRAASDASGGRAGGGGSRGPDKAAAGSNGVGGSAEGDHGGNGSATAGKAAGGNASAGKAAGGDSPGRRDDGGTSTGGSASGGGGLSGSGGGSADAGTGGPGTCDVSDPPPDVAAWIDESWNAEGRNNMSWHQTWLADAAVKGDAEIDLCVRYGATRTVTIATRDLIAKSMQRWFNKWFAVLYPYDCFPYRSVTVRVTGWAVKPGQESLLEWTDRSVPVYTEVSDGTDQAKGEPKCPDTCGFFFHPDHVFTKCPGGAKDHFDYTLWLNDKLPSGAAAEGSDWGVRIPVDSFVKEIDSDSFGVMLHEMGHGFGLSDYYTWKGSKPAGGSVMIIGSSTGLTTGDQWIVRRYWKETKALRYRDE